MPCVTSGAASGRGQVGGQTRSATWGSAPTGLSSAQGTTRAAESFRAGWQSLLASLAQGMDGSTAEGAGTERIHGAVGAPAASLVNGSLRSASALTDNLGLQMQLEAEKVSTNDGAKSEAIAADTKATESPTRERLGVAQSAATRRDQRRLSATPPSESGNRSRSTPPIKATKTEASLGQISTGAPLVAIPLPISAAASSLVANPAAPSTAIAQPTGMDARVLPETPSSPSVETGSVDSESSLSSGARQTTPIPSDEVLASPSKAAPREGATPLSQTADEEVGPARYTETGIGESSEPGLLPELQEDAVIPARPTTANVESIERFSQRRESVEQSDREFSGSRDREELVTSTAALEEISGQAASLHKSSPPEIASEPVRVLVPAQGWNEQRVTTFQPDHSQTNSVSQTEIFSELKPNAMQPQGQKPVLSQSQSSSQTTTAGASGVGTLTTSSRESLPGAERVDLHLQRQAPDSEHMDSQTAPPKHPLSQRLDPTFNTAQAAPFGAPSAGPGEQAPRSSIRSEEQSQKETQVLTSSQPAPPEQGTAENAQQGLASRQPLARAAATEMNAAPAASIAQEPAASVDTKIRAVEPDPKPAAAPTSRQESISGPLTSQNASRVTSDDSEPGGRPVEEATQRPKIEQAAATSRAATSTGAPQLSSFAAGTIGASRTERAAPDEDSSQTIPQVANTAPRWHARAATGAPPASTVSNPLGRAQIGSDGRPVTSAPVSTAIQAVESPSEGRSRGSATESIPRKSGAVKSGRGLERSSSARQTAEPALARQSFSSLEEPPAGALQPAGARSAASLAVDFAAGSASAIGTVKVGETFDALDSAATLADPSWVHAGAHKAEAGFEDPSLGWVSVRAESGGGKVHAEIVPDSSDAAQALSGHLAGVHAYLAEHHTTVETVTVAAPESRSAAMAGGHGAGEASQQGTGHEGGRQTGEQTAQTTGSGIPSISSRSSMPDATSGSSTLRDADSEAVATGGIHISVMA